MTTPRDYLRFAPHFLPLIRDGRKTQHPDPAEQWEANPWVWALTFELTE